MEQSRKLKILGNGRFKMKVFDNPKDCKEYLDNKAKPSEVVCLDERSTITSPRRINHFKMEDKK